MAKRYVDCTLTIKNSEAWVQFPRRIVYGGAEPQIRIEPIATVKQNRTAVFGLYGLTTQCYTHMESKYHMYEDGRTLDEVPLDWFITDGAVVDMMHKKPGEAVTAEDLEKSGADIREGDTIIIRTGWTDKAFGTREFWADMIHLSEDAGDWIVSKKPRALMQDFMTDISPLIKGEHGELLPEPKFCPVHFKTMGADMLLIEWCANLGAISKPRVQVIALPLKVKGTEGAPARVIVVEED